MTYDINSAIPDIDYSGTLQNGKTAKPFNYLVVIKYLVSS